MDTSQHEELEHFFLDHSALSNSDVLLGEINQHLAEIETLQVAIESSQPGVALEGLGQTLLEYWEKFVAFLKRIWEKIVEFCELHFTILGRRRLHVNRTVKKIKSLSTNPEVYQHLLKKAEFMISPAHAVAFTVSGQACQNAESLMIGLAKTQGAVRLVTMEYSKHIAERASMIERALQGANIESAKGALTNVVEELTRHTFSNTGAEMLGNVSLSYGAGTGGSGIKTGVDNLDQYRLVLTQKPAGSAINFRPMSIIEMSKVYEAIEKTLVEIDAFKNGEYRNIVQHSKTMLSDTDRFVKSVGSYTKSGDTATYRELLTLNRHYLNWIKEPTIDLIRHVTSSFFTIGVEMENNIQMYEPKQALNLFKVLGIG